MFVRRSTSARIHSSDDRVPAGGVARSAGRSFQTPTNSAITPEPRCWMSPPIDTRSFISVVNETLQPSPGLPSMALAGMRVSVK